MTGKERIACTLAGEPIDHIGVFEEFWGETERRWVSEGHVKGGPLALQEHFGWDIEKAWPFSFDADVHHGHTVLEETETTVKFKDGNGAILRRQKNQNLASEHIAFTVHDRESWEEYAKPLYKEIPVRDRIGAEGGYMNYKRRADRNGSYLLVASWHVFQDLLNLTGHENLLFGMADDPEWVEDMIKTIADLSLEMHEELFSMVGKPDGLYIMEDLGYKESPFFSKEMFRRFYKPVYTQFADFAHSNGLKLFFHSDGFIEPLLPDLIDCGIDCLTAIEYKAGMDLKRIAKNYGDKIAFCGGLDMRVLESNDISRVDALLEDNIPYMKNYRYILASDHSTSPLVNYETFTHFVERGVELGTY